jgi:hypothetical protein
MPRLILATAALWFVAVVGVMGLAAPAGAAEPAQPGDAASIQARKHYEEGTKAFNLGEFARAITEFRAAYNAKPDPLLLYNIAQSYRLAGDAVQAAFFYKSFLRNMPNAPNRKEVEGRIKVLEKQIGEQRKDPGPAPTAVSPPPTTGTQPPPPEGGVAPVTGGASAGAGSSGGAAAGKNQATAGSGSGAAGSTSAGTTATPAPSTTSAGSGAGGVFDPPPAGTATAIDLTAQPPTEPDEPSRPIYKRWWFWTGIGVLVLLALGGAAAAARKTPDPALGLYDPMFTREAP